MGRVHPETSFFVIHPPGKFMGWLVTKPDMHTSAPVHAPNY